MPAAPYYVNMHTHCFTLDHVPENFFDSLIGGKRFLRISKLKKTTLNKIFVLLVTRSWFIDVVGWFSENGANQLKRLKGLIKYSSEPSQEALLRKLDAFYKAWETRAPFKYVPLLMDMEFMEADLPAVYFEGQLEEIKSLKKKQEWKDKIYPFVFADPNRNEIAGIVKKYIEDNEAPFSGIKIYPALGHYPFDERMKEVYLYALQKNLPVVTHCIDGSVYNRKNPDKGTVHPVTGKPCYGKNAGEYQLNRTHPLNYECLLNQTHLKKIWGEAAPDLSRLKICIGHFGGENEWMTDKRWYQFRKRKKIVSADATTDYLDINQEWFGKGRNKWFPVIMELIRKYPNVYADISFTLHAPAIYTGLKEILKDDTVKHKILFGTDYYVVSSVKEENDVLDTFRKELNDDSLFELIAYENPKKFLNW
jgi:predicted TIM-barrel fold metal-dependent hydrolase